VLTGTKLRALKPEASLYRVADSNGLAVEDTTSGAKLWRYRYRLNGRHAHVRLASTPKLRLYLIDEQAVSHLAQVTARFPAEAFRGSGPA